MKLKFFVAENFDANVKASIHSSGKLGFTDAAIKKFDINVDKGAMLAQNEDLQDPNLYLKIIEAKQAGAFRFSKAGTYYYINAKLFFDTLGYDYRSKSIKFDIIEMEYEGEKIYKLLKTEKDRKSNDPEPPEPEPNLD